MDAEYSGRVTWTPVVGKMFLRHGPGKLFTPGGTGGGRLEWQEVIEKKGFRPKLTRRCITKRPMEGA